MGIGGGCWICSWEFCVEFGFVIDICYFCGYLRLNWSVVFQLDVVRESICLGNIQVLDVKIPDMRTLIF